MWSWRWEREEGSGIEARVARRNKWVDWRSRRMVDCGRWAVDYGGRSVDCFGRPSAVWVVQLGVSSLPGQRLINQRAAGVDSLVSS